MSASILPLRFRARVVPGRGRGTSLSVPTLNLDLRDVPSELAEGIFAGRVTVNGQQILAAFHHGPRPTFDDDRTCEAHLLDTELSETPTMIDVEIMAFLRPIEKFADAKALTKKMHEDIARTRDILRP